MNQSFAQAIALVHDRSDQHELFNHMLTIFLNNKCYYFYCDTIRNQFLLFDKIDAEYATPVNPTYISFEFIPEHNKQNIEAIATRILNLLVFS